jgi:protein kinase
MNPENDLVATTGIKLADFGLAHETKSKPPYVEQVSIRWYHTSEALLFS